MADDPATPPAPAGTPDPPKDDFKPPATQADLDRIIEQRLARERQKFADYDALKDKAAKFDQLDEANKTELQKAQDRIAELERQATSASAASLRAEVALSKGLTAAQAKRLQGSTKEELEQDADELLTQFAPPAAGTPPTQQPRPHLAGGTQPPSGSDEMDPAKLAGTVRRL